MEGEEFLTTSTISMLDSCTSTFSFSNVSTSVTVSTTDSSTSSSGNIASLTNSSSSSVKPEEAVLTSIPNSCA